MRLLRTLTAVTVSATFLSACAGSSGQPAPAAATPQFVQPSAIGAATPSDNAPLPSTTAPPTGDSATGTPSAIKKSAAAPSTPAETPKTASRVASPEYVFPVKSSNVDWHKTHAKYPATDIFADCGKSVLATTSGVVLEISLKDVYVKGSPDGPNNGGLSVSLLGDDGVRYYGSHLSQVQSGIQAGVRVEAGQVLGKVGRTGNANNVCHLHFGISPPCAEVKDWKVRRGVVWPWSYLSSWRNGGDKSPVSAVAAWKRSHNCKA